MDYNEDLNLALIALKKGGVILYPTDTIWGLGCDATNADAVAKIFRIKERAESKSLIILVNGFTMLERYVRNIPDVAASILDVSEIEEEIIRSADYVVKYRQTDTIKKTPSSVIKVENNGVIKIIRQ